MKDCKIKMAITYGVEKLAKLHGLTNSEIALRLQKQINELPVSYVMSTLFLTGAGGLANPATMLRVLKETLSEMAESSEKTSNAEKLLGKGNAKALQMVKVSLEASTDAFRQHIQENIVVRELLILIGISLDEHYTDNIKKYAKGGGSLYSIDMATFKPYALDGIPKNFTTNLFRTKEDAYKALAIIKELTCDYAIWKQ